MPPKLGQGATTKEERLAQSVGGRGQNIQFAAVKASLKVDLEHKVYYPGSMVRGLVTMDVRKPTKVYAIRIRVAGKESIVIRMKAKGEDVLTKQRETFWKELVTLEGVTKTRQTLVGLKQKYRNHLMNNATIDSTASIRADVPTYMVEPGTYTYPFQFQLPYGLPASFEEFGDQEDYAAILYYVKAYIDVPGGSNADVIGRTFFRVISRISEEQLMGEAEPLVDTRTHTLTACCLTKGTVTVTVRIPHRVVSIGDDRVIPLSLLINNEKGNEPVNRVVIELNHIMKVTAKEYEEERRTTVGTLIIEQPVEAGKEGTVEGKLQLPTNIAPTMTGLLLSSTYELFIEYDVPFADDPSTTCPITIVQRRENEEPVPPFYVHKVRYSIATGLHERRYVPCPGRESEYNPAQTTTSISVRSQMADRFIEEEEAKDGELENQEWFPKKQAHLRPDEKLWAFKPPQDYH